jgi:ribosome-associated protein
MSNTPAVELKPEEVSLTAVRAQGPGGQNVNKVSSAIHLRFDIAASSLPPDVKDRLLTRRDQRITREGVILIKAQRYRTQEHNRDDALQRLQALIDEVTPAPIQRRPTRPSKSARQRRLTLKTQRSQVKALRGKIQEG